MSRLDDLIALRDQVNAEINKESAAQARIARVMEAARKMAPRDTDGGWREQLIAEVAAGFDVTSSEIVSESRRQQLNDPRRVIAWLFREHGLSYPEIGRLMNRHHTTIMHGLSELQTDPELLAVAETFLDRNVA
jgi:chromosomal replication initiation ATPase DnaA